MSNALAEVTAHARRELAKTIVGQDEAIGQLLLTVVCGGHALIEGVPGLAKTLAVRTLGKLLGLEFHRVQSTPDLMPADITGASVLRMATGDFVLHRGPVFTDLLLVDEINRMPPRTQSSLLEAMEERQVTIDGTSHPLTPWFTTFATQNPVEFEGTYPLPEAQLDRFLIKIRVTYPDPASGHEEAILERHHLGFDARELDKVAITPLTEGQLLAAREAVRAVHVEPTLFTYIATLARRTRDWPAVSLGASPRAAIALLHLAKAVAASDGRDYALPDDVKAMAAPVLRHRLVLRPEADLEGVTTDHVVSDIVAAVEVPKADRLAPAPATGTGGRAHRVSAGVGARAFWLLGIGALWLIPAAVDRRAVAGLVAWDLFVAVLWILDLRRLPAPAQLRVTREWAGPLGLGRPATVALTLEHDAPIVIEAQLADAPSTALRRDVPEVALTAWPGRPARGEYAVTPTERGDVPVGPVTVRYASAWKLATRWARVPVEQTVRVYPDLHAAQHHVLHLVRSQSLVAERRRARQHGAGREFERLRDYRDGDDRRDVCWTATARRGKLVTRLYRPERSQTVWIMLDGSRLLRARAGDRTKLDAAVDAALALAHVAQASGDRIGLVAYGRRVHARIAPDRGARHLRRLLEVLAQARAEAVEGDHAAAAAALLRTQQRRALIVWLTDLAETAGVPDVIECASQMADRHLVLCAMLRQMDVTALADTSPSTPADLYRVLAAQEVLDRRETLLRGLRRRGALALDLAPGDVASAVVQRYLAIKEASAL